MEHVLIVDAANVVGSVPDGWWRDRAGAARRLRDSLDGVAEHGLPSADGADALPGPFRVILVVEGAARQVESVPGVTVVSAPGTGDDTIVDLVKQFLDAANNLPDAVPRADGPKPDVIVVTADRGLRERVTTLAAQVIGPRSLRYSRRRG